MSSITDTSLIPVNSKVSAVEPVAETRSVQGDDQATEQAEDNFRKQLESLIASRSEREHLKKLDIRIVERTPGELMVELRTSAGEHLQTINAGQFVKSMSAEKKTGLLVDEKA
ncbi:hypothetical protein EOPP23_13065 [Endozoicomonas sp. OPT23]|uniref:hypothetical protein n=1 Tax=Endozoicomonas sp. OPT23 TaxID=2072845 RepID=UPI00129BC13E|nr:hypothetical protein [Endozoicomonas sp. OPT23]MRI33919.1 hypothetical protein [Endozoicomonas sp. OPT23]